MFQAVMCAFRLGILTIRVMSGTLRSQIAVPYVVTLRPDLRLRRSDVDRFGISADERKLVVQKPAHRQSSGEFQLAKNGRSALLTVRRRTSFFCSRP